jgi:hypothetical protein
MNISHHIFVSLETIFLVEILKFFDADSRSGIIVALDPGWKTFGSGINIRIRDKHPGSATLVLLCTYRFDATLVDDSKGTVPNEVLGVELVNPHARRHRCNRG